MLDDRFRSVIDIVAYRGGFLAVGIVGSGRRWVTWSSRDGRSWTMRPFTVAPGAYAGPSQLSVHAGRLVMAGNRESADGSSHIAVWTSDDGVRWDAVRTARSSGWAPPPTRRRRRRMPASGDVGGSMAGGSMSGAFCIEGCYRSYLWTSADGRDWTRAGMPRHIGPDRASGIEDVIVGRGRFSAPGG